MNKPCFVLPGLLWLLLSVGTSAACRHRGSSAPPVTDGAVTSDSLASSPDSFTASPDTFVADATMPNAPVDAGAIPAQDADSTEAGPIGSCTPDRLAALEAKMTTLLSAATITPTGSQTSSPAPAFTLFMQRDDGRSFLFNNLDSTPDTAYQSASTSKLVSAAIILSLVDRGALALDDHPQTYIAWPSSGPASQITLRQLLSFTSGLNNDPPTTQTVGSNSYTCIDVPPALSSYVPWDQCVAQILAASFDASGQVVVGNNSQATAPGASFYYSSNHLQVAGLMAIAAVKKAGWQGTKTGKTMTTWGDIFADYQARTGLFVHSAYDLPSATNPRLAGGMHWTVTDYSAFLLAAYRNLTPTNGQMLASDLRRELFSDERAGASVLSSPVLDALGEDWHYSLGNWIECPLLAGATAATCAAAGGNWYSYLATSRCCVPTDRHSSPGAYGSYPFIDNANRYVGVLATMIDSGGFRQGLTIFRQLGALPDQWARNDCSQ
jgi:CubicO group peptidase (beta-lactamase class C family)